MFTAVHPCVQMQCASACSELFIGTLHVHSFSPLRSNAVRPCMFTAVHAGAFKCCSPLHVHCSPLCMFTAVHPLHVHICSRRGVHPCVQLLCAPTLCAAALRSGGPLSIRVLPNTGAPVNARRGGKAAIGKDAACQCSIEWDSAANDPSPGHPPATSQRLKGCRDMPSKQAGC